MGEMDKNQMWEIIDLVIMENIQPNEAVKSHGCGFIRLEYSAIRKNTLYQCKKDLEMHTISYMTIPTLRIFIKEVIELMRYSARD